MCILSLETEKYCSFLHILKTMTIKILRLLTPSLLGSLLQHLCCGERKQHSFGLPACQDVITSIWDSTRGVCLIPGVEGPKDCHLSPALQNCPIHVWQAGHFSQSENDLGLAKCYEVLMLHYNVRLFLYDFTTLGDMTILPDVTGSLYP